MVVAWFDSTLSSNANVGRLKHTHMKRTIIEFQPSDRNIVLFSVNDKLIGINYWHGLGDFSIANQFLSPDHSIDIRGFKNKPLSTAIELIEVIDDLIRDLIRSSWVTKPILIPQGQLDVVKKALNFYIETSQKLNALPTEQEAYDLFDAKQLCGMMDYPIHITITKEEQIAFTGKYGIDFPEYIY